MLIYVERHGRTSWNEQNLVLGRTDIPLDETGLSQAKEAALALYESQARLPKAQRITRVLSSPLKRALLTAEMAAQALNLPLMTEQALIEHDFGLYEGTGRCDEAFLAKKHRVAARYEGGGESYFDLAARLYPFLKSLPARFPGENILLVTHNGICRMIAAFFEQLTDEEFYYYVQSNAEIRRYALEE